MPNRLPYSRVVDVVITTKDRFPARKALNTVLILNPVAKSGKVDATIRTKVYADMDEVAADWAVSDEAYLAAQRFFQRTDGVGVRQLKIGYHNPANAIQAELNLIAQYDSEWVWLIHTRDLNDTAKQRDIADWCETRDVIFGGDSNDTDTETPAAVSDVTSTVTVSIATPAVVTWASHGLVAGDPVVFTTSGALPTGIVAGTTYYVISAGFTTGSFQFSATVGGAAVNTTGTQSGVQTATSPRFGGSFAEYLDSKGYRQSAAFYHTDPTSYLAASAWGYTSGRDFDRSNFQEARAGRIDSGQAYTLKFKAAPGVVPVDRASAAVQAITGFVPATGIDRAQGHLANTVVDIGGVVHITEGTMGSGAFVDEVHAGMWLRFRLRETILGVLANEARIPYDDNGMSFLADAGVHPVMRGATAAGIIADFYNPTTKQTTEAYQVSTQRVADVLEAQRRQRIAPTIKVRFRYAGAIHYVTVNVIISF